LPPSGVLTLAKALDMTSVCPVCSSKQSRVVYRYSADQAAQFWIMAEQEPERHKQLSAEISSIWQPDEVAVHQCDDCDFRFADPFVAGSSRFYELAFGKSGYRREKWDFRQTIAILSRLDCRGWDILEIGAGGGFFLDQLSKLGISKERCFATEYNAATISEMRDKGYQAVELEIEELKSLGKKFDAIFMFQVLEHSDRIDSKFETLHDLLKEGGNLFITVPNSQRVRFNEMVGSLPDMPPNHISQWSPGNIEKICERFGFRLVQLEIEPFSLFGFVKRDSVRSYMFRAQQPGTIANFLYPRRKNPIGRALVGATVCLYALKRIPVWIRSRSQFAGLGSSIWARMEPA
jgi:2-polyprenyl-3-methyl-5-hydroxy-6-metoxy-1,4-benzoquinol methylase